MSRIINLEGAGKQRQKLTREVVLAIRKLMAQTEVNDETRDLAAFISANLDGINETIEATVTPWEKRDYWVKADKFRMEWSWCAKFAAEMRDALIQEDWQGVAQVSVKIADKLGNVKIPKRNTLGEPWHGAWRELNISLHD